MANTFELIASSTVGSGGAANITFSSIASTYTDLVLKFSLRTDASLGQDNVKLYINGGTANQYLTTKDIRGNGSAASSSTEVMVINGNTATSNTFGNGEIYIPNYAGSTNKSMSADSVSENNATTAFTFLNALLWSQTSAITSIAIGSATGNLMQYSTAYLYGVKNA
jgi:hypothetical protein